MDTTWSTKSRGYWSGTWQKKAVTGSSTGRTYIPIWEFFNQWLTTALPHTASMSINTLMALLRNQSSLFSQKFHTFLELAVSSYGSLLFHRPLQLKFFFLLNFILCKMFLRVLQHPYRSLKAVHLQNWSWRGPAFESSQTERLWFACHRLAVHHAVWLRGELLSVPTQRLLFF